MRLHRKPVSSARVWKVQWVGLFFATALSGLLPSFANAQSATASDAGEGAKGASPQAFCVGAAGSTASPLAGMNHWSYGLKNLDRYYKRDPKYPPKFWLQEAIGDFNYVIGHNQGSAHPFLAEVHMQRAHALTLSGKTDAAWPDYVRAIQLNPNIPKAYLDLARSYAESGLRAEALDTATRGLRCLPSNKSLQQAYVKYGGKLPYPAPVVRAQQAEPGAASKEALNQQPTPVESGDDDPRRTDSADHAASTTEERADPVPPAESDAAKTQDEQTVLERACRFCPPDEIQQRWRESFQTGQ